MEQAVCNTSGNKLWACVSRENFVTGVSSFPDPTGEPDPRGNRTLPLYGDVPEHDLVTEVLSVPDYRIEADRVMRSYSVREKTAKELLQEISWWWGAMHSKDARAI
jgi:hypothetical protein